MDLIIRAITPQESDIAADLERECLHTAWSAEQIRDLPPQAIYLGAFQGEALCGILSAYLVADEVQVMNLAVYPQFRRQGMAKALMYELIDQAKAKNCFNITLEVAENNASAISLYENCGFSAVGNRKGFYGDVSAVIMEKLL